MMELIECKNLCKNYKDKSALKDVNVTFEKGKIYGLIGRNGAGKTTLLSIMSAQNPASGGSITVDGEAVWENPNALKKICFSRELNVSQTSSNGLGAMKVKEYLKIASIYYPLWDKDMAKKLVNEFELDVNKKMGALSKGMLSMVTIVVALASKAPYTFLDEPVAGLDVIMREYFYKLLVEEYSETGRTFIISTHIIEEASPMFEEVVMIKNGTLILKENTEELIASAFHVNGKAEDVDAATEGLSKYHEEIIGRSKGVTVFLKNGEKIKEGYDVTVQPVNLQQIFVALCGMGA
ncbi:MAG: ABC transporter ATP-binding protein [Lachnospiraceae bacterium]|nr:ABC transporter ATP-binding protein [Lachnospiraceae bacterium]